MPLTKKETVKSYRYTSVLAYLCFLVWPLFALFYALANIRAVYARNIIWFFCIFFGFTFIISDPYMDANRYRDYLSALYLRNDQPFWNLMVEPFDGTIYSGTDVYNHGLSVMVSRFTGDFRIFFAIVALVYGFFYASNVVYVLKFIRERKLLFLSFLCLFVIAFLIPFWNINGYRFYTAAHIFIFAALRIVVEKRYKYLWLIALTPVVHFSFAFPVVVIIIYLLFRNRYVLYFGLLALSLLFAKVDTKTINENAELAPVFMQNKVKGYTTEDYIKVSSSIYTQSVWYVTWHSYAIQGFGFLICLFLFLNRKAYMIDDIGKSLFSFGLLFWAMSNFVASVPSMGRFQAVALIMVFASILYLAQLNIKSKLLPQLTIVLTPLFLLFIIVVFRIGCDFIGFNTLLLNLGLAPFFPDSPALIEFFK